MDSKGVAFPQSPNTRKPIPHIEHDGCDCMRPLVPVGTDPIASRGSEPDKGVARGRKTQNREIKIKPKRHRRTTPIGTRLDDQTVYTHWLTDTIDRMTRRADIEQDPGLTLVLSGQVQGLQAALDIWNRLNNPHAPHG